MQAFISRQGFQEYIRALAQPSPEAAVEASGRIYDGCGDFVESLSAELSNQLPPGFYFDLLNVTFDYASGRLRHQST